MPDIFGKELDQYKHLAVLKRRTSLETVNQHLRAKAKQYGHFPHDFNALNRGQSPHYVRAMGNMGVGFITNNLQAILTMTEEILYTGFLLERYIPLVTDIAEGAGTYGSPRSIVLWRHCPAVDV